MKKITLVVALTVVCFGFSQNNVSVETSQSWMGYVNAFNVSDSGFAFGFSYDAPNLRATATTTNVTLEPNIAIWTAEASNEAWFDQGASQQTATKFIEAISYIEDNNLAGSDLTFSGSVTLAELGPDYTVVAFIKALDPNSGFATVVNNVAPINASGDFTIAATAAELASGLIIQYGFSVTGPLADPADTTLGSIVVTAQETAGLEDIDLVSVNLYPNPSNTSWNLTTDNTLITSLEIYNVLGKQVRLRDENSNRITISTNGLAKGIYIAKVTTTKGTKSMKLIKN
jgi:hypothetical protein